MVPIGASAGTSPAAGPHLTRRSEVLVGRVRDVAAPPHRYVNRLPRIRDMRGEDGRVLDLTRAAVDRRHAKADTLATLEATLSGALIRAVWRIEVHDVSPDDEHARGVLGLGGWWGRRGLRLSLSGNGGVHDRSDQRREDQHGGSLEDLHHGGMLYGSAASFPVATRRRRRRVAFPRSDVTAYPGPGRSRRRTPLGRRPSSSPT